MEATIQLPQAKTLISEVLTLEEVADYLRLPIDAVRDHAVQGLLPGNAIKGEWRFLKSAIDRWLITPRDQVKQDFQAAQSNNDQILALLASWDTEDQEEHQTKTWNHLKFALENSEGLRERAIQS
jgi:Helix-turn-helix domain